MQLRDDVAVGLRQNDVAHGLPAVHAKAVGTLGLDGLNGFQTAAERFGHVAAAQKRQTGNAADLGIGADAHLGQAIIN